MGLNSTVMCWRKKWLVIGTLVIWIDNLAAVYRLSNVALGWVLFYTFRLSCQAQTLEFPFLYRLVRLSGWSNLRGYMS